MKTYTFVAMAKDLLWRPRIARRIFHHVPGLQAVVKNLPHLVLVFSTVPHAEKSRERLMQAGIRCGQYIMEADWERETGSLYVHGPVCGWENVDQDLRARVESDAQRLRAERETAKNAEGMKRE